MMGQMHRFIVHSVQRSKSQPSLWTAAMFIFGHRDLQTCQMLVDHINASLSKEMEDRPKNLMVIRPQLVLVDYFVLNLVDFSNGSKISYFPRFFAIRFLFIR